MHSDHDPQQNIALVKRFIAEVQVGANLDTFWELIHPDFVDHTRPPGVSPGPQGVLEQFESFRSALSDFDAQVVIQLAQDDLVSTHKIFIGRHTGDFVGIAASGAQVALPVADTIRIRDGKLVEHWGVLNVIPLLTAAAQGSSR
jgi:predicted ester cyclase